MTGRIEFPDDLRHVAFAGDWHADERFAEHQIARLPDEVEVVLHTGDFGYRFSPYYLNAVDRAATRAGVIVAFVDGNHEDFSVLHSAWPVDDDGVRRLRPRVWHLPRGMRWEWSGLRFLALGGAHSVDRQHRVAGIEWWPQETITIEDALRACEGGPAEVMLTHDAPAGHHIPGLLPAGTFPSEEIAASDRHREVLRRVVDVVRPRAVWHGHYHSRYTAETDSGCVITGLGAEGRSSEAFEANVDVVDLAELATEITP